MAIRSPVRLDSESSRQVLAVRVDRIQLSSTNPRSDLGNIDELAASIQLHGLLQPILVRRRARGYDLIAGHRRLAAVRQLGWATVPALVPASAGEQSDVLQMVENLQRKDLAPEEEAAGLAGLMQRYGWSTREVANAIRRSQPYISKRIRVYEDPGLRKAILEGGLAPSAAEELLTLEPERRAWLTDQAVQWGWGVEKIREAVRAERENRAAGVEQIGAVRRARSSADNPAQAESRRPAGFTRMLKDVRGALRELVPEDLTESDRRELRRLFVDLAAFARMKPRRGERVFPSLPVLPERRRTTRR